MVNDKYLASVAALAKTFITAEAIRESDNLEALVLNFFKAGTPAKAIIGKALSDETSSRFLELLKMDDSSLTKIIDG